MRGTPYASEAHQSLQNALSLEHVHILQVILQVNICHNEQIM